MDQDRPKRTREVTPKMRAADRANLRKANAVDKAVRYRLTPRRLAACRANLAKANAVDRSIRCRPTEKRLAACQANLLQARARQRKLGERSPAYGVCFRHGLYAASLERSAELAGESGVAYRAHLERFEGAFAGRGKRERELARGMAEAAWRCLRAVGGQACWEACSLAYRLAEARQPQRPRPELLPDWAPELGEVEPQPIDRAERLVEEILGIFNNDMTVREARRQLIRRLERLGRLWLTFRYPGQPPFSVYTWPRKSERRLAELPSAAAGNPLLRPRQVARTWAEQEGARGGVPARFRMPVLGPFGVDEPGAGRELAYGLMRGGWRVRGEADAGRPGLGEWPWGVRNFAAFLADFHAAFEGPSPPSRETARSPGPEVRAAARLAWRRLGVYRRQAGREARGLKALLEREAFAPGPLGERERLARLLLLWQQDEAAQESALELQPR